MDVVAYLALAVALNIPLGAVRTRFRKLSPQWFVAIHAFIPFLLIFRVAMDVSPWWIPAGIAFAVLGQLIGARVAPAEWKAVGDRLNAERDAAKAAAKAPAQA